MKKISLPARALWTLCGLCSVLALPVRAETAALVEEAPLRAHLSLLASDLFEGRGTGQRGGDLTVAYLEAQAMALGLQPANGKSYRQPVQIAGVKALPQSSSVYLEVAGKTQPLRFGDDWVWWTGDAQASHQFDQELVFVGYGITAPDEHWDDYKGVDCKGKILVMMVNDPQPTAQEPDRFGGKALTYYGRWSYKFEEAKRRGAAGALLIHTDASATYGWGVVKNGGVAEHFQLQGKESGSPLHGWITDATARQLFAAAGKNLDDLRAAAEKADFRPVALPVRLMGETRSEVRQIAQFNVAGIVPGTDPQLNKEVVIYSAHWDHLGKQEGSGDTIYNGAVDNASGTAALLAMAKAALTHPAKRSQMFLWVAAEEQGLLGSAAYAAQPLWPLQKTAANLNLDAMNFVGMTRDISAQGSERTELAAYAKQVAADMQLQVAAPRPDTSGGYFRSDHFNFAKAGVPAFSVGGGRDYIQNPQASAEKARAYGQRYHQVTDEYDPAWDLSGMVQQAQFTLNLGYAVANAKTMPAWKSGDPFAAARRP
jgi:Zn-dependent M28 family amino/carboxypeptidase